MRGLGAHLLLVAIGLAMPASADPTSCTACHGDPEIFPGEEQRQLVEGFATDVHARAGLSCHDCHGGDPDPALADDLTAAMDPDHPEHPFRSKPDRREIPALCGSCHSDLAIMRRFDPSARVDQEREYATSRHGIALAQGDPNVATCVSCHTAHRILPVDETDSPVHPSRVADTCGTCHADADRMAAYKLADGRPLPIDQVAGWRSSVHARALQRGDLSAPTCNDCHGNHGALPPGLDSLSYVCGQCHGREAELFRQSPKHEGFVEHNEAFLSSGADCETCHDLPAVNGARRALSECATCHGNHRVLRPTIALLSPLPATPCAFCHEGGSAPAPGEEELEPIRLVYEQTRDRLLAEAEGLEGDALFDWMLDQMLMLPPHLRPDPASHGGGGKLLPAFTRLFDRFRLGRIHHRSADGASAAEGSSPVRCNSCHVAADGPGGAVREVGSGFVESMRELTVLTARADRTLLAARRGGVAIQESLGHLDKAIDAQIELEALVHGFRSDPESPFARKQREGLEHARAALAGGQAAMAELDSRRRGLAASLVIIAVVLVALALKIRSLPSA